MVKEYFINFIETDVTIATHPEMTGTKTLTGEHPVFVLSGADTSIKGVLLPVIYADLHFLHQSKIQRTCQL